MAFFRGCGGRLQFSHDLGGRFGGGAWQERGMVFFTFRGVDTPMHTMLVGKPGMAA